MVRMLTDAEIVVFRDKKTYSIKCKSCGDRILTKRGTASFDTSLCSDCTKKE